MVHPLRSWPFVFASLLFATAPARAQSALESVGEAFRTPALTRTRSTTAPSPLDNLDDTQHLNNADGPRPEAQSVHPTIAALRGSLWYWLDETERRRLSTVDATRTSTADTPTLQLFLADRALRRFAPMALAVLSRRAEAVALRSAPAIRTMSNADAVARLPVIARILRRRERVEVATAAGFARRLQRLGAAINPTIPTDEDRELAADRAVAAASEAARTRDPAEVAIVIAETNIAYGGRAARSVVVDEAIHLLEELVAIARGNPAVERPLPPLPVSIDPDANELPIAAVAAANTQRATPAQARARRARNAAAPLVRRAGPDARCYDDFRCFQD